VALGLKPRGQQQTIRLLLLPLQLSSNSRLAGIVLPPTQLLQVHLIRAVRNPQRPDTSPHVRKGRILADTSSTVGLHRAINDALADVELVPVGPLGQQAYVDATIERGLAKAKSWSGTIHPADHPVNIEAAEFLANGNLVLGLRYPVTADGHPLLVELTNVGELFDDPDAVPVCGDVWILGDVGGVDAPAGLRGLDTHGDDLFDAVIGDLDASGKSATVLADHPEGALAASEHVRFELPPGGGVVGSKVIHHFGDIRRVEGVAVDHEGHAHYVIDEEGHVALRTLVFD